MYGTKFCDLYMEMVQDRFGTNPRIYQTLVPTKKVTLRYIKDMHEV